MDGFYSPLQFLTMGKSSVDNQILLKFGICMRNGSAVSTVVIELHLL